MIHAEIPPFSMQINKLTKNVTLHVCLFFLEGGGGGRGWGGQKLIKQIIFHKINVFCDFFMKMHVKSYIVWFTAFDVHCNFIDF